MSVIVLALPPTGRDEDPRVRGQVLHNMCDGSPPHLQERVIDAITKFSRDEDKTIRRRAHKVWHVLRPMLRGCGMCVCVCERV